MPAPFEMSSPVSAIGRRRRAGMTDTVCCVMTAFLFAAEVAIADIETRGGQEPADIDGMTDLLRQDPYDLELLISFGTSTGGSAGHLALGIRDEVSGDDRVYSANFHADQARKHESGFYTEDLMISVPKKEYLFKTVSSLGETSLSASTSAISTSDRSSAFAFTAFRLTKRKL